jgi:tetratricopeptide (TPR) repeat protein
MTTAVCRLLVVILAMLLPAAVWAARSPAKEAERRFRAGWSRFQLSVAIPHSALVKPVDVLTMRQEAIREMQTAVALRPRDPQFLESLGYLHAEDLNPLLAAKWYLRAAEADPRQPRVFYLLAQSYAALIEPKTPGAPAACARAAETYDRALRLDSHNGLLLLESAEIYHRAGLDAEAARRLERGLDHIYYRLYTLPAPADLALEGGNPAAAWFGLQEHFWSKALSAAHALAQWSVSLGRDAEKEGRRSLAETHYQHAVTIGLNLTRAEPKTVATVLVGLRCQELGLGPLAAMDKASRRSADNERLERVRAGIQAALSELASPTAATSVQALLGSQAGAAERILAVMEGKP